jgi:hypothetical protein
MSRLIPSNIGVHGDVNVNINLNAEKIGDVIQSVLWVHCFTSIIRSRLKK